jgi:hypothetical protein
MMADNNGTAAQAILQAAKDFPAVEARLEALEARVKQLESFLGHIHIPASVEAIFQEFPKAVGDLVAYSAEEERALLAAAKSAPTPSSAGIV